MRESGLLVALRRLVLLLLCTLGSSRRPDESPRVTADKMKVALNKLPEKQRQNIQSMVDGGVEFDEVRTHMALQNPDAEIEPILRGFAAQRAKEQSKVQAGTGLNKKRSAASKRSKQVKKAPVASAASKDDQSTTNRAGRPRPPTPPSKNSQGRPMKSPTNQKKSGDRRDALGAKDRAKVNTLNNRKVSRRGVSDGESSKASSQRVRRKSTGPLNNVASKASSRSVRTKQGPKREGLEDLQSKPAKAPVVKGASAGQEAEMRKERYSKPSVARSNSKKRQRSLNAVTPAATGAESGSPFPAAQGDGAPGSTPKRAASKGKSKKEGPSKSKNKKGGKRAKADAGRDSTGWPAFTLDEASNAPHGFTGDWHDDAAGSSGGMKPFEATEGITAQRAEESQQGSAAQAPPTSGGVELDDNAPSRELAEVEVTDGSEMAAAAAAVAVAADTDEGDPSDASDPHDADFSDEDYFYDDEENFDEKTYGDYGWSDDAKDEDGGGGNPRSWKHWRRDDGSDDWQEDAAAAAADFYDLSDAEHDEDMNEELLFDSAEESGDNQEDDDSQRGQGSGEASVDTVPA